MAQLVVRNLDPEVRDRLRERAVRHGRSMEAKVREILRAAAYREEPEQAVGLGTRISQRFAGLGLREGELAELPGQVARAAEFE